MGCVCVRARVCVFVCARASMHVCVCLYVSVWCLGPYGVFPSGCQERQLWRQQFRAWQNLARHVKGNRPRRSDLSGIVSPMFVPGFGPIFVMQPPLRSSFRGSEFTKSLFACSSVRI